MTIKELETRTGLDRGTVRFYEKEGFLSPERKANGYREYSEEDAVTLEKIAFLRRLDLSLEIIRAVQQGELPLGVALEKQREHLLAQREEKERALRLCDAVRTEGASYQTLQPGNYTAQLPPPEWMPRVIPAAKPFRDDGAGHPFLRLFARTVDELLVRVLMLLPILYGLRIRMDNPLCELLLIPLGLLGGMLLEPLLLSTWGYTPGKWCLGLRLRAAEEDGERTPTFREAFARYWQVQLFGHGLGIFPFDAVCAWKCGMRARDKEEQPWDCGFVYTKEDRDGTWLLACICIAAVALAAFAATDSQRPIHRTDVLTRTQYVENINDMLEYTFDSDLELTEGGIWFSDSLSSKGDDRDVPEIYEENGVVVGASMTYTLTGVKYSTIPSRSDERISAVLGLAAGDRDVKPKQMIEDLYDLFRKWEGTVTVGRWTVRQTAENLPDGYRGIQYWNEHLFYQGDEPLNVTVHFSIERTE